MKEKAEERRKVVKLEGEREEMEEREKKKEKREHQLYTIVFSTSELQIYLFLITIECYLSPKKLKLSSSLLFYSGTHL